MSWLILSKLLKYITLDKFIQVSKCCFRCCQVYLLIFSISNLPFLFHILDKYSKQLRNRYSMLQKSYQHRYALVDYSSQSIHFRITSFLFLRAKTRIILGIVTLTCELFIWLCALWNCSETNQIYILPLLHFVNTPPVKRINKPPLFRNLRFSIRKGRNLLKPLAAWYRRFILGIYLCLQNRTRRFFNSTVFRSSFC